MKISRTLLIKFSQDRCTTEEVDAIREWLDDGKWPELENEGEVPADVRDAVWKKLQDNMVNIPSKHLKTKKRRIYLIAVAAVLFAVIGSAVFFYYSTPISNRTEVEYAAGTLKYKKVILSDSSIVFLSPNSSIRLIQPFPHDKRNIELKGEASFDVVKDATRPFTVNTGKLSTTALGTSFKITSFPGKDSICILLSYGKVVVKNYSKEVLDESLFLDPGEGIVYEKSTHNMWKTVADPMQFDYKNNILYFSDAGIKEVVEKLERYYHVEVKCNSLKGAHWRVSGEFDYQPLEIVMNTIAFSCNIKYEISGDKLILTK